MSLIWDKPGNHAYSDVINVVRADGSFALMTQDSFRKQFPHLVREEGE